MTKISAAVTTVPDKFPLPGQPAGSEKTIWQELGEYFKEKYFDAYLARYDNFELNESSSTTIMIIIVGFVVGMMAALIIGYFRDRSAGRIVRALVLQSAFDEKSAKTLEELGIESSFFVRRSLRGRSFLRKYVHYVGEPTYSTDAYYSGKKKKDESAAADTEESSRTFGGYNPYVKERFDCSQVKFYIPDDLHYAAEVRYEQKGRGNSPVVVILGCIFLVAFGILFLRIAPVLLRMADNLITMLNKK